MPTGKLKYPDIADFAGKDYTLPTGEVITLPEATEQNLVESQEFKKNKFRDMGLHSGWAKYFYIPLYKGDVLDFVHKLECAKAHDIALDQETLQGITFKAMVGDSVRDGKPYADMFKIIHAYFPNFYKDGDISLDGIHGHVIKAYKNIFPSLMIKLKTDQEAIYTVLSDANSNDIAEIALQNGCEEAFMRYAADRSQDDQLHLFIAACKYADKAFLENFAEAFGINPSDHEDALLDAVCETSNVGGFQYLYEMGVDISAIFLKMKATAEERPFKTLEISSKMLGALADIFKPEARKNSQPVLKKPSMKTPSARKAGR